ncbi:MAG: GGDEF domain-containing protein [Ktedonobacteraceae bacterium]|nr:GGDEF domain-containing protein [Ktedonobacteraceae bacterium]
MKRFLPRVSDLRTSRAAWGIILTIVVIYLLPYLIPGLGLINIPPYSALSFIPILGGAFLRGYKGSLLTWTLIASGIFCFTMRTYGVYWPALYVATFIVGNMITLLLGLTVSYFFSINRRMASAMTQLAEVHAVVAQQALTDAMTELPNRRAIYQDLQQEIERSGRSGHPLSLLFFDADHFKHVNDTYGHAVGDAVLHQIGVRASTVLRPLDILGRFGGEEFVVILPDTTAEQAQPIAERIRTTIASHPLVAAGVEGGIPTTISMGVATFPADGMNGDDLLEQADQAMYEAKRSGRNRVCLASAIRQQPPEEGALSPLKREEPATTF